MVTFESAFAEGEYGDFTYAERLWNGKTLWSPCSNGRVELIVDIEMRNEAVDAEQLFTLDTIDMTFHDLGGLRFKRCGDTQAVPLRKAKAAEECAGVGGIECVDGLACDFSNNLEWRTGVCEDPDGDNEPGVDGSQCGGVARKTCQDGLVCRTPGEGLLGECVDPSALRPNLECGDGLGTCGYGASCKKRLDDPNSPGLCLLPAGEGGVCIGVYDAECKEGLICDTEDPTAHTGYRTDGAGYVVGTCRLSTD